VRQGFIGIWDVVLLTQQRGFILRFLAFVKAPVFEWDTGVSQRLFVKQVICEFPQLVQPWLTIVHDCAFHLVVGNSLRKMLRSKRSIVGQLWQA